jgi:hypothetical protein
VYYTQKFVSKIIIKFNHFSNTQLHGVLAMKTWLKLNLLHRAIKRAWTKLYIVFENFKIPLVLRQIKLSKLKLKLKNHEIILHKIGHNFVKKGLFLIH